MSIKTRANHLRRKLFKQLTRNLFTPPVTGQEKLGDVKRVLIIRPNHRLGNVLLITPLVQEVLTIFPEAEIDLFTKGGIAPTVFKNYPPVKRIIQLPRKPFKELFRYMRGWNDLLHKRYDLVINAVSNSSSGKLALKLANAAVKLPGELLEAIKHQYPQHRHIALYPVYSLRSDMAKLGKSVDWGPTPYLDLKLSDDELRHGREVLRSVTKDDRPTIALYTYATGDKCLPPSWWEPFYRQLVREFAQYNIIEVLPVENVSQISFRAPSYYSKDIREIGSVIANTIIFIGADSGIMHLASASRVPTIGLFGVTDIEHYKPYNPGSMGVDIKNLELEELMTHVRRIVDGGHK